MLTSYALQKLAEYLDQLAVKADYTIGGTTYQAKLRRSIVSGNVVRKHLYLTQNDPVGMVARARLLDAQGNVIAERTDQQAHEANKGLLLEFSFVVQQTS